MGGPREGRRSYHQAQILSEPGDWNALTWFSGRSGDVAIQCFFYNGKRFIAIQPEEKGIFCRCGGLL